MKKFIFLVFFLLIECSTTNKVYICGDHECKNKKERNDYFNNNISMEVYVIEKSKEKRKNLDLVQLNFPDDEKLIDKVSKQKATHDLEILNLRKANLVAYKKQLDSLNNSRSLQKVA